MAIGLTNLADFDFSRAIDDYEQNGQNVWQSAYQKAMSPYEQEFERSSEILKSDYSDAINKAYESYVVNKRAAEFSNYGTGDVRNMIDAFRKSYEENKQNIYDTYLEKQSSLDTTYFKQALSTQNLLDEQKSALETNFDTVLDSSHKYLSDLFLSNPLLFNSNPFLNQFTYFNDETGQPEFVDYTTFIELLTEPGTGKPKAKGGIEDLINLITSLGGKNQKDVTSYESYLMKNKDYNSFYNWLKNEGGLYTMYDILGFDENNLFKQGSETQDTLAVTFGSGDNQRTMYKYVDYSTGKTYEPLDPTNFRMDGDNIIMYDDSYDLQYSDKEVDNKISSILNIMSTGLPSPESDKISEGTVQIYDNNIYKFDGERWIKMVDGDYKVSDMIDLIQDIDKSATSIGKAQIPGNGIISVNGINYRTVNNKWDDYDYWISENVTKELSPAQIAYGKKHEDEVFVVNDKKYIYTKRYNNKRIDKDFYRLNDVSPWKK